MQNRFSGLKFGDIVISKKEKKCYSMLNHSILSLCKTLPAAVQSPAILFILEYSNTTVGKDTDFFKNFYKSVWTIIPNISGSHLVRRELTEEEYWQAVTAHAMALFLHSLDDHLNDGQLRPSHLLLLIRSQAWMLFNKSLEKFPGSEDVANTLINEYYKGICSKEPGDIGEYCSRFRKEISTWYIIPSIISNILAGNSNFTGGVVKMAADFGTAWRLLDDIQDIDDDIVRGEHTAIYLLLPENIRKLWDAAKGAGKEQAKIRKEIFSELSRGCVIEALAEKITRDLAKASEAALELGMPGLAKQYKSLGAPVEEWLKKC